MNIIILIEDKPEEMEKGKAALTENGLRFVSATNLSDALRIWEELGDKISGVLTDLNFPEKENRPESACGFAVVTRAISLGVPCSICTDVNHHFCGFLKFFLEDIEKISGRKVPFTTDSKNWIQAVQELIKIIKREE